MANYWELQLGKLAGIPTATKTTTAPWQTAQPSAKVPGGTVMPDGTLRGPDGILYPSEDWYLKNIAKKEPTLPPTPEAPTIEPRFAPTPTIPATGEPTTGEALPFPRTQAEMEMYQKNYYLDPETKRWYRSPPGAPEAPTAPPTEEMILPDPLEDLFKTLEDYLAELQRRGQVVSPTVEITPEKAAEFMAQAGREIEPYYASQLALAREEFMRSVGYSTEDIKRQEAELERTYGRQLGMVGAEMAERGFAYSGPRRRAERELAEATQRGLEETRRRTGFAAGTAARAFAREWGGGAVSAVPTIGAAPRVLAGTKEWERPGGEAPFYEISPETYEGLVGAREWEKRGEKKRRAVELEETWRAQQELGKWRELAF